MWPFKRKLGISVAETSVEDLVSAWRKAAEQYADAFRTLEKRCGELREDLDALAVKHERLRGRVYGAGLHRGEQPAAESREQMKARILGQRFTPGKPAQHGD